MYKVEIDGFVHNGKGVGRINGKIVFVECALPGEIVNVRTVKEKKDYISAEIVDIESRSQYRIEPKCPYYGACGGCNLQHVQYEYQLELKKGVLKNVLKRIAKIETDDIETVASDRVFNYRRRMKFQCKEKQWGLFKRYSREFIGVHGCAIADERINEYIKTTECHSMEIIVSDNGNINQKNMVLDLSSIKDGMYITYRNSSFVQVNREINLKIIKTLIGEIIQDGIENVFDFFGGIGNFSIPLAAMGVNVSNFEIDKKAIDSFLKNVKRLGLENRAKAFRKDLSKNFDFEYKFPECVVLDPPRSGAKSVVRYILKHKPDSVFYISCEPSTLARDLKILKKDYLIKKIVLFDMFPQTYHFETFVKLGKRSHLI